MPSGLRHNDQAQEDASENCYNGNGRECAATPSLCRYCCLSGYQGELQSVLSRARRNTGHARRAFNGSNLYELIDGQAGRTGSRAFSTIDTSLDVAADLCRTEQ